MSQRDARAAELAALLDSTKAGAAVSAVDVAKYLKLVQLGQPIEHVKARMKADGVDPDLLPSVCESCARVPVFSMHEQSRTVI